MNVTNSAVKSNMKFSPCTLRILVILFAGTFFTAGCSNVATVSPLLRIWRTSNGEQVINAEAIDARYDRISKVTQVYLKTSDGKTKTIPFNELDKKSREFAWYDIKLRRGVKQAPPGTVKFTAIPLSPVDVNDIPDTVLRNGKSILLGIDDRIHALGTPPEGWCGEVTIQEVLLYYGAYYPQSQIYEAGNPIHPDLYANELPIALKNLGMEFQEWPWRAIEMRDFLDWLRKHISAGVPVLAGVKIYPTKHKDWGLDHFVLAVGVKGDALVLNFTGGTQYTLTERELRSEQKGYAFANRYNCYFGISITGWRDHTYDSHPVRLFVQKETSDQIALIVKCEDLEPGVDYSLYKLSSPEEQNPKPQITFKAKQPVHAFHDIIDTTAPAIYRCQKVTDGGAQ